MDEQLRKILSQLERKCSKCECCSYDIFNKAVTLLAKASGSGEETEDVREKAGEMLELLKSNGYVDDCRYAAAFAREKSSLTGWGPVKIRFALRGKHIDSDAIENAISGIDSDRSTDRLLRLLEAKWKSLSGKDGKILPDSKLKLIKFALSRGYGYDEVKDAVEGVIRNGQS